MQENELEIDEWGEEDFSDIINLPRPVSKHKKMALSQRAKQFMPFEAVREAT